MASRRIVRNSIKNPEELQMSSVSPKYWKGILIVTAIFWKCIKILWYWLERIFLFVLLIVLIIGLAWWLSQKPSNYRDWNSAESILPSISSSGRSIVIKNVRNHQWTSDMNFVPGYYDEVYDLDKIETLYYMIVPFSNFDGPAHMMLSFGFSDGKKLVISAEVRKERGESFAAIAGVMNQFELMYVIGSEDDIIKLRTNVRKNTVYMYPIVTPKETIQNLFQSMLIRADKLQREPEFYNTIWNNCTTSILMHANALRSDKIPWTLDALFPAHSDELVYALGLIDTKLSLPEAREYYKIGQRVESLSGVTSFSESIRKPKR